MYITGKKEGEKMVQKKMNCKFSSYSSYSSYSFSSSTTSSFPLPEKKHFHFVARCGKGGMGEVWKAMDLRNGRYYAIRLVRWKNEEKKKSGRRGVPEDPFLPETCGASSQSCGDHFLRQGKGFLLLYFPSCG